MRSGERSDTWQKLKLENQQEFVIGGYRPGSNGIDALLVGYYDDTGLRFAGKVRAGFVPHLRREVFKALKPHHVDDCPFVDLPMSNSLGAAVALLRAAELPTEDLTDSHLRHFFMASSLPVGLVGLELHGRDALLRSLVVDPNSRTNGIGSKLVEHAENYARARGVDSIYLLTTGKITVLVGV